MNKKTAQIFLHCGFIFWLIAFFNFKDQKEVLGTRLMTQGLILAIVWCIPCIGYIAGTIFTIMAIVNIAKGDEDYKLPIFGEVDWFNK
ncbi:MAG: hypothetical protein K5879_10225 [Lachnospiraceae bacterium]|nr:hypothetical protein [Lachnospiraceae bacterium]